MLSARAAVTGAVLLVAVGACTSDGNQEPKAAAPTRSATTKAPDPDQVDRSARKGAQKTLDRAFDRLMDDKSGEVASYVNFAGSAIKMEGRFDLVDRELDSVVSMSPAAGSESSTSVRSRVIGKEIYAGPTFGPWGKCWFRYAEGVMEEILPGELPFDEESASIPTVLVLASDAKAIGPLRSNAFDIRAKVSAQTTLVALSSRFAATVIDDLPTDDLMTEATIIVRNGVFSGLTIRAQDVADTYKRAGIDLFDDAAAGFEKAFRSATLRASFRRFGTEVSLERPAAETIIDFRGVDDVDESNATCSAKPS